MLMLKLRHTLSPNNDWWITFAGKDIFGGGSNADTSDGRG